MEVTGLVSHVIPFLSYWPSFCYELPCAFTAAICVHGLPSVHMNSPNEHHHWTQGAKHTEHSLDQFIGHDFFTTPPSRNITEVLQPMSFLNIKTVLELRIAINKESQGWYLVHTTCSM